MALTPQPAPGLDRLALTPEQADASLQVGSAARGRLRLRTLILLRWIGIAGQTLAILGVAYVLNLSIPVAPCLGVVAVAAWVNVWLTLSGSSGRPFSQQGGSRRAKAGEATLQLGFDIVQLSALLWLTGGTINPFSVLLIAPVTLAAATLPGRNALALAVLAVAASLVLAFWSMPLPWTHGETFALPFLYRIGVTVATVTGVVFTAGYAYQAAMEAERMELALNVTRTVLAREQRLGALGALAAAAAHELGTPLATIAVVAKEMARGATDQTVREDAALMVSQAQRCREILTRLTEQPETEDVVHGRLSLLQFVHEAIEPHAHVQGVTVEAVVSGAPGEAAPDIQRLPEMIHATTTFIENAVDFARSEVLVMARFDADSISVEVLDDGPGFAADVLAKLGEPYVTSRPGVEGGRTGHVGMGLGFFIAKTLLERTGAVVDFRNGKAGGAVVKARWDRSRIEAAPIDWDAPAFPLASASPPSASMEGTNSPPLA